MAVKVLPAIAEIGSDSEGDSEKVEKVVDLTDICHQLTAKQKRQDRISQCIKAGWIISLAVLVVGAVQIGILFAASIHPLLAILGAMSLLVVGAVGTGLLGREIDYRFNVQVPTIDQKGWTEENKEKYIAYYRDKYKLAAKRIEKNTFRFADQLKALPSPLTVERVMDLFLSSLRIRLPLILGN